MTAPERQTCRGAFFSRVVGVSLAMLAAGALAPASAVAALSGTSDAVRARGLAAPTPVSLSSPTSPDSRAFDGTWEVRTSPGCATLTRSTVSVSRGKIRGPGVSGKVDPAGNVRTVGRAGFLSIVSTGRVGERTGSGVYRQSDGCTGTWQARKR